MNLIEKFENMPFQDVGTFNSIFKTTPILGFKFDEIVQIGNVSHEDKRRITVGDNVILMSLSQKKLNTPTKARQLGKIPKVQKVETRISNLYKILSPSEFMIYYAIKEAGEFSGIGELSKHTSLTTKTISSRMPKLLELGLINKTVVWCERSRKCFSRLTATSSVEQ
jgi:hypothetical protein